MIPESCTIPENLPKVVEQTLAGETIFLSSLLRTAGLAGAVQ
jgi:hypothetical protein